MSLSRSRFYDTDAGWKGQAWLKEDSMKIRLSVMALILMLAVGSLGAAGQKATSATDASAKGPEKIT